MCDTFSFHLPPQRRQLTIVQPIVVRRDHALRLRRTDRNQRRQPLREARIVPLQLLLVVLLVGQNQVAVLLERVGTSGKNVTLR